MHRTISIGAISILLTVCTTGIADENFGSVQVIRSRTGRFDSLAVGISEMVSRGAVRMMETPRGKSFLVIWLDLAVVPGVDGQGRPFTQIDSATFRIVDTDGTEYLPIGHCTKDGRFGTYVRDFTLNGPPVKETYNFNLVFAPPNSRTSFTLRLGQHEHKVVAPSGAPQRSIDRARIANFSIQNTEVARDVQRTESLGSKENEVRFVERLRSTSSRYLIVDVRAEPRDMNARGSFTFRSSDLGMLFGAQVYVPPAGYFVDGEFYPGDNTYTSEKEIDGSFKALEARLVFPVPGVVSSFRLLYLARPIAEGEVPK